MTTGVVHQAPVPVSDQDPAVNLHPAADPLAERIRGRLKQRDLLLMTHIVLGYPSLEANRSMVAAMVEAGVDLMELQIPFSEPTADGPVILQANAEALARGTRVDECLAFAREVSETYDIPFLMMGYYNTVFRRGVASFIQGLADHGLKGAIVPDLPPEEGQAYLAAMANCKPDPLAPVFIYSPRTPSERMRSLASHGRGFIYCVARRGVTGAHTDFDSELNEYLARCRAATDLPLALGFGVRSAEDIAYLRGKTDIAVVGSETLRVLQKDGLGAVGPFIRGLR